MRALRQQDVAAACVAHAHLAYLFNCMQADQEQGADEALCAVDERAVLTLLSAQVFLNINYHYTLDVKNYVTLDEHDEVDADGNPVEPATNAGKSGKMKRRKTELKHEKIDSAEAELMLPQMASALMMMLSHCTQKQTFAVFQLFQRHRCTTMQWINDAPSDVRARVLYRVVQLVVRYMSHFYHLCIDAQRNRRQHLVGSR